MPTLLRCTVLVLTALFAAPGAVAVTSPAETGNPRIIRALETWLKFYERGRIDARQEKDVGDRSIARRFDLVPKGTLGAITPLRDLEILLDQATGLDDPDAVEAVIAVAVAGLDARRELPASSRVRRMGAKHLAAFAGKKTRAFLLEVARGEELDRGDLAEARRSAAIRALGSIGEPSLRPFLEDQLAAEAAGVRLAAAEALGTMASPASIEALIEAVREEQDGRVVGELATALDRAITTAREQAGEVPASGAEVARAALRALGRADWRADMSLVHLLDKYRIRDSVPALIALLERFANHPEDIVSGRLSGLLRHRAHQTLVGLTGARFPAEDAKAWREWWNEAKDDFRLVAREAEPSEPGEERTVGTGFFGIPVEGTRITFILDISGSMAWAMERRADGTTVGEMEEPPSRMEVAKVHLLNAVRNLPEVAHFNLVTFSDDVEVWKDELQQATDRNKAAFERYVDGLDPLRGTNLWAGLDETLEMKALAHADDRYGTYLDEIFLLSDGAPSVGEVTDPEEILRLVAESNRYAKVRINTVFISSNVGRREMRRGAKLTPSELMEKMAAQNGGKFVEYK